MIAMPSEFSFAHKLANVLKAAKFAAGPAWDHARWLDTVNEFVNAERPVVVRTRRKTPLSRMTDEELIAELSSDPTYTGIDVSREVGKCRTWCKVNGKKATAKRIVNWMNKADRTLTDAGASAAVRSAAIAERTNTPPAGWQAFMQAKIAEWKQQNGEHYDAPGASALAAGNYFGMPKSWRDDCWKNDRKDKTLL